ncbi:MAG: hypothetical protein BWK80_01160 [Desulfobacteraceae bacterium IS3]|nr:MAG: hypothetical protein BWK80_01160 [Desulfobacteraceae bacterium IS3]
MSDNLKWKAGLLSSSMPLELEASRTLVSKGFAVSSNYKYDQSESGFINDFSVDIHAKAYTPFSGSQKKGATAQLELLIECRQRHPKTAWLFMPDANISASSPAAPGNMIRMVDKFSSYIIESNAGAEFDAKLPVCQKGIEIDMEDGEADESAVRQGVDRLQNALPHLLTENVLAYIEANPAENIPFLFCPIFLTNIPLLLLNKDTDIKEIEACSDIREIAAEVPYLMMKTDYNSDFKSRCVNEIQRLEELHTSEEAMIIERKRAAYYESPFNLPFTIIDALIAADRYYMNAFFTQFVICSHSHFPDFVETVKDTVESALETRKYLGFKC